MPQVSKRPLQTFEDLVRVREQVQVVDDRLVHSLPTTAIQPSPRNPRLRIDIDELAESLRTHGLLQPVVVRRRGAGYELIAGHRRFEAAKRLGWSEIAAVVRDETDEQAYILTLVENLQREDLEPREEAAALEVLVRERGWSTRQVGEAIKRSHTYVIRRLRVFDDPVLAPLVLCQDLPVSTAEELLRVSNTTRRQELAQQAADEHWERPQVRRAVADDSVEGSLPGNPKATSVQLVRLAREIQSLLDTIDQAALSGNARTEIRRLAQRLTSVK